MLNSTKKFVKSEGIDLPVMYVYLAGRIAGNCIDKCLAWRKKIIKHYKDYKPVYKTVFNGHSDDIGRKKLVSYESYPIAFLDALNSKEADSIDKQGLTSAIPPNLIYDKDMLSVKRADVIVANMEDWMEVDIEEIMKIDKYINKDGREYYSTDTDEDTKEISPDFEKLFFQLQDIIKNRRPNYGTNTEVAWALWLEKPTILIAGSKKRKKILETHPFTKRASVIVENVEELLEKKWLNIIYKSISSAIY